MSRVIYSPSANDDLVDIAAYIAQDKPDAAFRWVQAIKDECELLAEQPDMGEERLRFGVPDCRSFSIGNYVVFYRAIEDKIHVARIVQRSRDLKHL